MVSAEKCRLTANICPMVVNDVARHDGIQSHCNFLARLSRHRPQGCRQRLKLSSIDARDMMGSRRTADPSARLIWQGPQGDHPCATGGMMRRGAHGTVAVNVVDSTSALTTPASRPRTMIAPESDPAMDFRSTITGVVANWPMKMEAV